MPEVTLQDWNTADSHQRYLLRYLRTEKGRHWNLILKLTAIALTAGSFAFQVFIAEPTLSVLQKQVRESQAYEFLLTLQERKAFIQAELEPISIVSSEGRNFRATLFFTGTFLVIVLEANDYFYRKRA
jgi:hypothetical protein